MRVVTATNRWDYIDRIIQVGSNVQLYKILNPVNQSVFDSSNIDNGPSILIATIDPSSILSITNGA